MKLVRALLGMRALMRELLEPYFSKMNMTHKEKKKWFSGRKDVLFGFSAIAYIMIRLPVIGILGYGIAQASAAYMLTIVTAPPNIEKKKLQQKEDKEMTVSEPKKKLKANEKTD
jgi:hypothetical protein